jgi:hypothetical protein
VVDIEDLVLLIEHWGQDDPMYDIAPRPYGDGVVDVLDLEVLMSYWQQELDDPGLVAHWKLDETEGDVAYDSGAENDAFVIGEAVWQPNGGQVDGTLEFDGINDYIITPSVLNPADGAFSILAWIKGGAPGQVILSQVGGANWLLADDALGNLKTDLKGMGRASGPSLYSDTLITDGNWHHIRLVWDREYRSLYVDDELVAIDVAPQDNFESNTGELCLGAQNGLDPGTCWSGMIDDVRIYDRVVTP